MKKDPKNTFSSPEGYFESFNERLFARLEAEEGEPNTDFLPKSDGFVVPKGYFKHFNLPLHKATKVVSLWPKKQLWYAAASIAVLMLLSLVWLTQQKREIRFEELASADFDSYFETEGIALTTDDLTEVFDLSNMSLDAPKQDELSEDVIMDYFDVTVDELEDLNLNDEALYQ